MEQPIIYNSHPDKHILESMMAMMHARTQPLTLYKVQAHVHVDRNE